MSKIPPQVKFFLNQLEEYVNIPLTYFGSIVRPDFVPGKSDIDAALFTDNTTSAIQKLSNYLNVPRSSISPFVIITKGKSVHGNKIKYTYEFGHNKTQPLEFLVYDKKYQNHVITENKKRFKLPTYIAVLFYILKFLYYNMHIINGHTYASIKRYLINDMLVGSEHTKFVLM
jgi:hypothetical protein